MRNEILLIGRDEGITGSRYEVVTRGEGVRVVRGATGVQQETNEGLKQRCLTKD